MRGNILDANSTNKLINQSVKDAVDNKFIENGYVTKDLLEAETTRATEQENSLKTLIGAETSARTKGDEDLNSKIKAEQTRAEGKEKEILDKLAIVNGDSNTEGSFRKAIAEKADASALLNEVTRATGAESGLQAAIATKADATALSNYVLTTALNKQVDTLNAAISAKQDAGNYIPYDASVQGLYQIDKELHIGNSVNNQLTISSGSIMSTAGDGFVLDGSGITFNGRNSSDIPTAGGDFIGLDSLANTGDIRSLEVGLSKKQNKITVNGVDITDIETADITKLRTIVTDLINALSESGLIRKTATLE